MTLEANIPKILDTPAKRREWLFVMKAIRKQKDYVQFYKKEVKLATDNLRRVERELKQLKKYRDYVRQGKPTKPRPIGFTKFEEEE